MKAPSPLFQKTQQMIIELLTTLNHEVRTPLTVIKSATSTLLRQEQFVSPAERREFLQMTSLTREAGGLGLGLTICKYLVALHHGRIWAERRPVGGSTFHVWLPIEGQSAAM